MTLYSKKRNFKNEFRKKKFNFFEKKFVHIFFYIFWHQTAHYLRETPKSIQANTHTHTHTYTHTRARAHTNTRDPLHFLDVASNPAPEHLFVN